MTIRSKQWYTNTNYAAQWGAWFLVAASILAATPLVFLVEVPLEKWRARRVTRRHSRGLIDSVA
jgi:peptidoglycan/LPS O-acetylase OafA/YrhL